MKARGRRERRDEGTCGLTRHRRPIDPVDGDHDLRQGWRRAAHRERGAHHAAVGWREHGWSSRRASVARAAVAAETSGGTNAPAPNGDATVKTTRAAAPRAAPRATERRGHKHMGESSVRWIHPVTRSRDGRRARPAGRRRAQRGARRRARRLVMTRDVSAHGTRGRWDSGPQLPGTTSDNGPTCTPSRPHAQLRQAPAPLSRHEPTLSTFTRGTSAGSCGFNRSPKESSSL